MSEQRFTCPGLCMPQPPHAPAEGYVGCYRAGHKCEVAVQHDEDKGLTRTFCGCCGTPYTTIQMPDEGWVSDA